MARVNTKTIEKIVQEVTPKVEFLTQWNCNLSGLNLNVIKTSQYYERCMKPLFENDEISKELEGEKIIKKIIVPIGKTVSFLLSRTLYGEYTYLTNTLTLIKENLEEIKTENELRTIVGHELVHRCQHVNNPNFYERYEKHINELTESKKSLKDICKIKEEFEIMGMLVEGDANFVEKQLKEQFYPFAEGKKNYNINSVVNSLMATILFKNKFNAYKNGPQIISLVYSTGKREAVNNLYNLTAQELETVFAR
jgi:hypothetical protein